MRIANFVIAALALLCCLAQASDLPIEEVKLPPGFKIELLARVDNAREMALGAKGTLFVGSTQAGKVYAVQLKPPGPPVVTVIASASICRSGWHFTVERCTCPRSTGSCDSTTSRTISPIRQSRASSTITSRKKRK